jgi:hypothetical protein
VILGVPVTASSVPEWVRRAANAINQLISGKQDASANLTSIAELDLTGMAGDALVVTAGEDGFELVAGGGGSGTVTTTGTPASGNLAKFSGATSIVNGDLSGDVSTSGTLVTAIGAGKVTLAMQANMATASVVYRKTAGSGAPEVQTLATLKTDLGLTGTNSGDQTITLTGDVTGSGTGSFAATIASNAVTTAKINNSAVTLAKIANAAANSKLLGAGASGSGAAYVELALGTNLSMSGTTLNAGTTYGYDGFGNLLSLAGLTLLAGASANLTLTNGTKAHLYSWSASGANTIQMAYTSAPGTPWDVYLRFQNPTAFGTNTQFGLALRNSSNSKILTFTYNNGTNVSVQEWTNATTFSSIIVNPAVVSVINVPFWFRINSDGTTLTFYRSVNGVDWFSIGTRTIATFMGAIDQVGLGGVPQVAATAWVSDFGFTTPA